MQIEPARSWSVAFACSLFVAFHVPRIAVAQGLPPVAVEVIGDVPEEQLTCEKVGGSSIIGVIHYSGAVRVSPLNTPLYISYGFTGLNGPSAFAFMQLVGGSQSSPGATHFNSSSPAGTLTLSVALQNTNVSYASPARGTVVLAPGGLHEVQVALGPEVNLTRVCVTQLALFVAGTQGQDLVGPLILMRVMDLDSQVEAGVQFSF